MTETIRILMTDDHPMIIEGYQNTLMASKKDHQHLEIDIANTCDESVTLINRSVAMDKPYDMLFVDIRIPPTKDGKINSGEDLAVYARKILPQTKIVILTMFNESFRIHNILKTVNPEGFLIKSDLTSSELASAFQAILYKPPFYSGTVNSYLRKTVMSDIVLDEKNRKILYLLSQGEKTKNLAEQVGLSLSAIEKRKKHLKQLFAVEDGKDDSLIAEAKSKGFL
ncbi:helix-turn-helix domain-containing protein [Mangrovimonas aestuarii]|uniref:DNA-binding response regulator n=1 Tax=Mangrovimonas aestuarii TaxID=3018443 RepID=UPI002377F71C|nr:DNA-binding response regulator [Mangrovimonas aestuarii]